MHGFDGRDQFPGIHGLEQIAARAGPGGVEHVLFLAVHGQGDDAGGGVVVHDSANGLHAVHPRHDDVHQDHVRLRRARQRHRLGAVIGFRDDGEAAHSFAELAQTLAHQGVVIGDQEPNRRHGLPRCSRHG